MSSRLPPRPGHKPHSRRQPAVPRPELRLEGSHWHRDALPLDSADLAELRRSIRLVRRLVAGRMGLTRGAYAVNDAGEPVDPLDDSAERFCVSGAFVRVGKPSPPLFVTWTRLCHEAAGDLLGDPEADLFTYNDDPANGREELLELLDEVEARLDLLAGRGEGIDEQ
jgi:hypothetical protein